MGETFTATETECAAAANAVLRTHNRSITQPRRYKVIKTHHFHDSELIIHAALCGSDTGDVYLRNNDGDWEVFYVTRRTKYYGEEGEGSNY